MRWAILILPIIVAGCGSPTIPTAERSDFSGVWQGEYLVRSCIGGGICTSLQGQTLKLSVRLSQSGTNAIGVLTLGDTFVRGLNLDAVNVNVTGTISPTGALTLTGSRPAASPTDPNGELQVTRFAVQRDVQRGLTGIIEYSSRYSLTGSVPDVLGAARERRSGAAESPQRRNGPPTLDHSRSQ